MGLIRFRIDGILHHVYELPAAVNAAVVSRLKILGRMDVAEKRRPQDGRVKTKTPEEDEVELRLSVTRMGQAMPHASCGGLPPLSCDEPSRRLRRVDSSTHTQCQQAWPESRPPRSENR